MFQTCVPSFAFEAATEAKACRDKASLDAVVDRAFARLGASVFVGVEARTTLQGASVSIGFGRTSQAWEAHYFAAGHAAYDPVVRHMLTSNDVCYWSDLTAGEQPLSARERQVFEEARTFGFPEGLAAPLHHPGGAVSAVLLMGEDLDGRDPAQRNAAQLISHAVMVAAQRLRAAELQAGRNGPHLSRREIEVLYLVHLGAADKAAAQTLGLSPATVAKYLRSAERKLGAAGRGVVARAAAELGLLPSYLPLNVTG